MADNQSLDGLRARLREQENKAGGHWDKARYLDAALHYGAAYDLGVAIERKKSEDRAAQEGPARDFKPALLLDHAVTALLKLQDENPEQFAQHFDKVLPLLQKIHGALPHLYGEWCVTTAVSHFIHPSFNRADAVKQAYYGYLLLKAEPFIFDRLKEELGYDRSLPFGEMAEKTWLPAIMHLFDFAPSVAAARAAQGIANLAGMKGQDHEMVTWIRATLRARLNEERRRIFDDEAGRARPQLDPVQGEVPPVPRPKRPKRKKPDRGPAPGGDGT